MESELHLRNMHMSKANTNYIAHTTIQSQCAPESRSFFPHIVTCCLYPRSDTNSVDVRLQYGHEAISTHTDKLQLTNQRVQS